MTIVIDHGHYDRYVKQPDRRCFMTTHVSKSQFKAKALEYFRQVETSGEPIIVTDHGKPALEIRRVEEKTRDPLEELKGTVLWYDRPFDPVDEDEWEVLK
jgi:prevent-host-death family protein